MVVILCKVWYTIKDISKDIFNKTKLQLQGGFLNGTKF